MICLNKKYTINNINLDEVIKVLNDYISTHNRKFDFHFINFEFVIEIDNNFIANKETKYLYNTDIINMNTYLINYIDCFTS